MSGKMKFIFVILSSVLLSRAQEDSKLPNFIGQASFPGSPAFTEVHKLSQSDDPVAAQTMYLSTFNALGLFQYDDIYFLRSPGDYLFDPEAFVDKMVESQVSTGNYWPNNPDILPPDVVGREGVVWTSGFLVPTKTDGRLNLYFSDDEFWSSGVNIASLDQRTWSYHRVIWKDMDNDGDLDAVTARFHLNTNIIAYADTEFLWLENPNQGAVDGWEQHVLAYGRETAPDVHFRSETRCDFASQREIAESRARNRGTSREKSRPVLRDFWCLARESERVSREKHSILSDRQTDRQTDRQDLAKPCFGHNSALRYPILITFCMLVPVPMPKIRRVAVDAPGQVFDIYLDDFNRDGKLDLLATVYDGEEGWVYVYDIDENWMEGNWNRRTIASGFVPNFIFGGQSMSPGSPKPFYPSKEYEESLTEDGRQRKPYISLSGDDDGKLYILTPDSEDPSDWTYTKNILVETGATTSGKIAIADMNNDGYTDIIGCGYSAKTLYFFTYAPLGEEGA
ncbi:unnamed protein product [Cyprideis torosa]|uniref:Uncharacterized protein n=1 Tax=Cyprideis torosa TaxID=163714 RepID=A0A7R8ZLE3_9CRUS|nr:unnamed protein product [Cyprideis torosa]CAG0886498.1 unnamed protein product [Cyprideis torosa]